MSARMKVIVAGVLVAVAITGLWFVLLWNPTKDKLKAAQDRETAALQQADQLQTRLGTLKALEKRAPQLEADRAKLLTAIPTEDEVDKFLVRLNEMATEAGVSWLSVSQAQPATSTGATGPASIGLQMQINGDYFAILRFVDIVRDSDRLMTLQSFSLSGTGAEMSASLSGQMYVSPDVSTATPTSDTPAGEVGA